MMNAHESQVQFSIGTYLATNTLALCTLFDFSTGREAV
jgi:hypothetical protein